MSLPMPESRTRQRISPLWSAPTPTGQPGNAPEPGRIRCKHCDVPIRRWNQWWVHDGPGGTFQCRGDSGLLHDDRYATPARPTGVIAAVQLPGAGTGAA